MKINIRLLYLYLFSFVGLLIIVFGSVNLVNLGLKTLVFPDIDSYEVYPVKITEVEGQPIEPSVEEQLASQKREISRQRQRQLVEAVSMITVGLPLYLYHWKTIQKENKNDTIA